MRLLSSLRCGFFYCLARTAKDCSNLFSFDRSKINEKPIIYPVPEKKPNSPECDDSLRKRVVQYDGDDYECFDPDDEDGLEQFNTRPGYV